MLRRSARPPPLFAVAACCGANRGDVDHPDVAVVGGGNGVSQACLFTIARSDCSRSYADRSARAGHAMVRRNVGPRRCRSASFGHQRAARLVACWAAVVRARATKIVQAVSAHASAESQVRSMGSCQPQTSGEPVRSMEISHHGSDRLFRYRFSSLTGDSI